MFVFLAFLAVCTIASAIVAIQSRRRGRLLSERLTATELCLLTQTDEHGRIQALLVDSQSARQDLSARRQVLEESLHKTESALSGALNAKQQTTKAARQLEATLRAECQRISRDLEATQTALEALKQSERNAVLERDNARARSLDAQRAQKAAEEEARQSRTAKESYAIEVKLLREELRRAELEREKAIAAAQDPLSTATDEQEAPVTVASVHVTTWWCQACGCGGTKPKKCCSDEAKPRHSA